jgi:hypothetical protein
MFTIHCNPSPVLGAGNYGEILVQTLTFTCPQTGRVIDTGVGSSDSGLNSEGDDAFEVFVLWNATSVSNRTWTPLTTVVLAVPEDTSVRSELGCLGRATVSWKIIVGCSGDGTAVSSVRPRAPQFERCRAPFLSGSEQT